MQQLFIRGGFVLATLVVFSIAVATAGGRYLASGLDDARVNALLVDRGIAVEGFNARWRLLNPVVQARRVTLGSSTLDNLVVEFDWVESLIRRAWVFRHLSVGDGRLRLLHERTRGWRPEGLPAGEAEFDWFDTLYQTDELAFAGLVEFQRGDDIGGMRVSARLVNRGGTHRVDASLMQPECPAVCRLRLRFDDREALWPLWYRELAASAQTQGAGIAIPSPLLAGVEARLTRFALRWDRTATRLGSGIAADSGIGAGVSFELALEDIVVPGGAPFALNLNGNGSSIGGVATARVDAGRLHTAEAQLALPTLWLQWTPQDARVYTPDVELAPLTTFFADTRDADDAIGRWLRALAPDGRLQDVRVRREHEGGLLDYGPASRRVRPGPDSRRAAGA